MNNVVLRYMCVCTSGALVLLAAGSFWQNKPASEWNDREIHAMLTHSPWAKEVTVTPGGSSAGQSAPVTGGRRGGGGGNGGLAGRGVDEASVGLGGSDSGMGAGGGRGGGGMGTAGMDTPRATPSFKFAVRWMSALPMQEAMQRAGGAKTAAPPSDQAEYLLAVTGIPAQLVREDGERLKQRLKEATTLRRKGQDAIAPDKVEFAGNDQAVVALFHFPRQPAITLEDKQVEFVSSLGRLELRTKFNLKDMTYNGKLEL